MNFNYNGNTLMNISFWRINWKATPNGHSFTEGGSSGSPLINSNRHVIGQLFGHGQGYNCYPPNCDNNPSAYYGNYGKFNLSWIGGTGNGASDNWRRLDHWLDPIGTNPLTIDGMIGVPYIIGPDTICTLGGSYRLNKNLQAEWSISPTWCYSISTTAGTSTTVTPLYGYLGTLTAKINGVTVATKTINACSSSMITELRLLPHQGSSFSVNSINNLKATFFAETYVPTNNNNSHEIVTGWFSDNGMSTVSATTDVRYGEVFSQELLKIDASAYTNLRFEYLCTIEVFNLNNGQYIYGEEYAGTTTSDVYYINMLANTTNWWNQQIYPTDQYKMVVTCYIREIPVIVGPDIIHSSSTYSISTGESASWSVSSGFSRTPSTGNSTNVTITSLNCQNGTITAVVGSRTITKSIQQLCIIGPDSICTSGGTYGLNTSQSATWSISPSWSYSISTITGVSTTVTPLYGYPGTLTATINGVIVATKTINACNSSMITELKLLQLPGSAINFNANDLMTTFYAETYVPANNNSEHEIVSGWFPNSGVNTFNATTAIRYGEVFSQALLKLDMTGSDYEDERVYYFCTIEVFDLNNNGQYVYGEEYFGTTNSTVYYLNMLANTTNWWSQQIYPTDQYKMVVTCYIKEAGRSSGKSMHKIDEFDASRMRDEEKFPSWEVDIYPNPTNGLISIEINGNEIPQGTLIEIYSAQNGNKIGTWTGISSSNTINILAQPLGAYLVYIIFDKENVIVRRIIKE